MWKKDLVHLLLNHEGLRLKPYRCSTGKLTIGVGRNLEQNGITIEEAADLLVNDIDRVEDQAFHTFPWISRLDDNRKIVIYSMIFNLGIGGVRSFKRMIAAILLADFSLASAEMLDSKWARQVKKRAVELAYTMRTGVFPEELGQSPD
jgi:lysozyme